MEQREVESAPDDRGRGDQLLTARAEPVEPLGHEIAHAGAGRDSAPTPRGLHPTGPPDRGHASPPRRRRGCPRSSSRSAPPRAPPSGHRSRRERGPARAVRCRIVKGARARSAGPRTRATVLPAVRRAIEEWASSSSRAVATRSAVHAGMRRLTKARSRRLISSAQCRSSSTSTRGWRAATCSTSSATLSNRGRALSLAGGRPAMPASGSRRVNSARRVGCRAPRISSSALTSPLRQASTQGPKGRIESLSWQRPIKTRQPWDSASATRALISRVLPMPASPTTVAMCPCPPMASPSSSRNRPSSTCRPNSGVSAAGRSGGAAPVFRAERERWSARASGAFATSAGRLSSS